MITRRLFLSGSVALTSIAAAGPMLLSKPRLPGVAYAVGNEHSGFQVVWADSLRAALDWGHGDCHDDCKRFVGGDPCDACDYIDVDRTPIFDGYADGGIPLHAYSRAGWSMPCVRCEAAGVYRYALADDRCAEDWGCVPTPDGGFVAVCHECMTIEEHLAWGSMRREDAMEFRREVWGEPWRTIDFRRHAA